MAIAADDRWRPLFDADRQAAAGAGRGDLRDRERRLKPFERTLRAGIAKDGPITVETYMAACNAHYYASRDPLGAAGDFITAPEISQIFGELVGAELAECWLRAGAPDDALFVELGPGRGTLAADALRTLRGAGFAGAVHLVETSPALRSAQRQRVPDGRWHDGLSDLPAGPVLCVANEFLDALPIRQCIGGAERRVMIAGDSLAFDRDGAIVETSPARDAYVTVLAHRLVKHGGVAVLIDYGHAATAPGDTLQAVKGHRFADILDCPGEQDLTAHVDFAAVAQAARAGGAAVTPLADQGAWLDRLGIDTRAAALATTNPDRAAEIESARRRLCASEQMGRLFKVIALYSPTWPQPPGFA